MTVDPASKDTMPAADVRFRALVDKSAEGLCLLDAEARIVYLNEAASRIAGHSRATIVGRPAFDFIHPDDVPSLLSLFGTLLEQPGSTATARFRWQRADGTWRWLEATGVNELADPSLGAVVATFRDATEAIESEERLRSGEARFRALIERSFDGVTLVDRAGEIRYVSRAGARLLGYAPDDLEGKNGLTFIHPDDRAATEQLLGDLLRRPGGQTETRYRFRRPDGSWTWIEGRGTNLLEDPSVGAVVFNFHDVTGQMRAQRALEDRERLFRALVEKSWDGIGLLDDRGTFLYLTPGVERFLGYDASELVGRDGFEHVFPGDLLALQAAFAETLETPEKNVTTEFRYRRKDGDVIWIEITGTNYLGDPSIGAVVVNFREVTERKAAEAEREALLYEAQQARRDAEAANHAKDEFLAMLGHEFRNPLAAVQNAIVTASLDESRRGASLEIARRQVDNLARLIDDLLDVARITQGKIALRDEIVFLAPVVEHALEATRPLLRARGHDRVVVSLPDQPIAVKGDPSRLEQIVTNLVGNAAKYTPSGGRIEVSVSRDGESAELRVRDDGIGIPLDLLPRVFDLFTQGERGLDRAEGGLGLGLTLVRRLVELHGGTIEAYSAGGDRGSEFIVRMPAVPPADGADREAIARPLEASGPVRILVVEDNVDAADSLAMLLGLLGHEVSVAYDGRRALEAAGRASFDVVLLDIGLPGMDGYEVARRLRAGGGASEAILVALTGYGRDEDRDLARQAGFDHHLVKPVEPESLQALLDTVLTSRVAAAG